MGLTYAANESGCLVGVPRRPMAAKAGHKVIGAVGGLKIPPVDIWIAGYKFCAQKAIQPGTRSRSTTPGLRRGRQVQDGRGEHDRPAGAGALPGRRWLWPRHPEGRRGAHIWGIGVDKDQYQDAGPCSRPGSSASTTASSRRSKAKNGGFKGGGNLLFNLKNGGMSVGKINPTVPKAFITLMNTYKTKIIKHKLKVPAKL